MSRIERYSNWGAWERLDGVEVRDGERLRVRWPDGTVEDVSVRVVDIGMDISDHGNCYRGEDKRTYAKIEHHGITFRVPLLGLEATRL